MARPINGYETQEVVTFRVSPVVKEELQALARRWGLPERKGKANISGACRRLVERGLVTAEREG